MYKKHFGLSDLPFSIAPDPRFLYMSDQHREALAHLVYGVTTDGGFVLLTGEVGTGKTTVCRCLLEQVPEATDIAFILNPRVTVEELLASVCDELGVRYPEGTTSNKVFIDRINAFLLDAHARGRKTVLVIEEAQNLSPEVLEQVRLLTNLETNDRKLLQIIMLGQPELRDMLAKPGLQQLSQRITARYHLGPLSKQEVSAYVTHRLAIAGVREHLFSRPAMQLLCRLSNGVPRLINLLCDRALLGAYVQDKNVVDRKTLEKAAEEVLGKTPVSGIRQPLRWALVIMLIVSCGAALAVLYEERTFSLPVTTGKTPAGSAPTAPVPAMQQQAGASLMEGKSVVPASQPAGAPSPVTAPEKMKTEKTSAVLKETKKPAPAGPQSPTEQTPVPGQEPVEQKSPVPLKPRVRQGSAPPFQKEAKAEPTRQPKEEAVSKEEVDEFMNRFIRAYTQSDLEGIMALYSRTAVENNTMGYQDIRSAYSETFREKVNHYRIQNMDIRIDGRTAAVSGTYVVNRYISAEERWIKDSGNISLKLARENGHLKIVSNAYDK